MSLGTNSTGVAQPANPWLSGITWGTKWTSGGGVTTIVYAPSATYAPNAAETAAYLQVFADLAKICNVVFVAGTPTTADILLNSGTFNQMNGEYGGTLTNTILGIADPPGTFTNPATSDEQSWVFVNRSNYSANALNKGGYDYITWLHEIGHAMGLAHPHDNGGNSTLFPGVVNSGDLGTGGLNQGLYTTMTYNDGWSVFAASMPKQFGWQATMMAFDIAALQNLYGANLTSGLGNDVYALTDTAAVGASYQCIWDAGGTDTIYYGGNLGTLIELRAATLDPAGSYGAGGFISYVYGSPLAYSVFTIANGVTIENASGGNGADVIVGNDVANQLFGYGGNDVLYGLNGNDFIWGGDGSDSILGGAGADTMVGFTGNDYMVGEAGADAFYLASDFSAGGFDFCADLVFGTDYIVVPIAYQGAIFFFNYAGSAYGYANVIGGGAYTFGAAGLTAAQLQLATFYG